MQQAAKACEQWVVGCHTSEQRLTMKRVAEYDSTEAMDCMDLLLTFKPQLLNSPGLLFAIGMVALAGLARGDVGPRRVSL